MKRGRKMKKEKKLVFLVMILFVTFTGVTFGGPTDFVFIIDTTSSMSGEIAAVRNGLSTFVDNLDTSGVDARFSIIVYGGAPELILDFTGNKTDTLAAFNTVNIGGSTTSTYNHNVNPEAGLEAIRIALGTATDSTLLRTAAAGGSGGLNYRSNARKNLILVTDEDSDRPFYTTNRYAGQTSNEPAGTLAADWQSEVDETAQDVIQQGAFLNLLINPGDSPSMYQYGDPTKDAADADLLNYDRAASAANYVGSAYSESLVGQVLSDSNLLARSFNIGQVSTANWIDNFYAAKLEETLNDPGIPGTPGTSTVPAPGAFLLAGLGTCLIGSLRRRRAL
jgi:hypothetical protein